jgi:hypothetical protein
MKTSFLITLHIAGLKTAITHFVKYHNMCYKQVKQWADEERILIGETL